ncbi:MAG: aminoacyl-tRNA hydrolase [Puniceicoccales bacterium]|jgi:PTH1 family peptidyl-tRNA hydrolase|nr:aminoacyl-tRNA hydrolase [Puniceicoccales bacterium]
MTTPAIIAGLGNPGAEYADTRHNTGFRLLDALAATAGAAFTADSRMRGATAKAVFAGKTVWLVKPLTYMNESGRCIGPLLAFLKTPPAELLVIYDDITLAPGVPKLTTGGGDGGHNGIKSLLGHLPNTFARYRVGIGPKHWPTQDLANHVLGKLSPDEQIAHDAQRENHINNIKHWLLHGTAKAQNLINKKTTAATTPASNKNNSPITQQLQQQQQTTSTSTTSSPTIQQ